MSFPRGNAGHQVAGAMSQRTRPIGPRTGRESGGSAVSSLQKSTAHTN